MRAPSSLTLRAAAEAWFGAIDRGEDLSRNRQPYKPSTVRGCRHDLETYVLDDLGALRLGDVRPDDLQALVDRLVGSGLSGSKVRNVLVPLQALYRRHRREVVTDPTEGLDLPAPGRPRERVASPAEAASLLAGLPDDRALWATAFYAGLRRGELRALRDEDLDLAGNLIHVRRGWDDVEGEVAPKSSKGVRKVPVPALLRRYLLEHRARTGRRGGDLFFGRTGTEPFTPTHIRNRAREAWASRFACGCEIGDDAPAVCPEHRQGVLEPIGLHEARHTYVSLMHAAGNSLEEIGDYVGHSSAYMTDRYRHLIEGAREQAAERLDAYLGTAARRA